MLFVFNVVDAADVRVCHLEGKLDFLLEACNHTLIGGDFRSDRLKGNSLSEFMVFGLINFSHAASSDKPDDSEAARDKVIGSEGAKIKQGSEPVAFISSLQKIARLLMLPEESVHFGKNYIVAVASARKKR